MTDTYKTRLIERSKLTGTLVSVFFLAKFGAKQGLCYNNFILNVVRVYTRSPPSKERRDSMTNKNYAPRRKFQLFCLALIFLCLLIPPSIAEETPSKTEEESAFSNLSNAIKKRKEQLLPKPLEPFVAAYKDYDPALEKALAKADIKKTLVEILKYKYPKSALSHLDSMTAEQKLDVAAGILYIKSRSSGRVSKSDIVRESAAIVYYANKYKVRAEDAFAMADLESHCNPKSVGRRGPVGAFQVLWRVHAGTLIRRAIVANREDMFDADKGVHAGVYVFSGYVHAAGSVRKSLRRYKGSASKRYTNMFFARVAKFQKVRADLKKSLQKK